VLCGDRAVPRPGLPHSGISGDSGAGRCDRTVTVGPVRSSTRRLCRAGYGRGVLLCSAGFSCGGRGPAGPVRRGPAGPCVDLSRVVGGSRRDAGRGAWSRMRLRALTRADQLALSGVRVGRARELAWPHAAGISATRVFMLIAPPSFPSFSKGSEIPWWIFGQVSAAGCRPARAAVQPPSAAEGTVPEATADSGPTAAVSVVRSGARGTGVVGSGSRGAPGLPA
jgi:hypothetical protein